MDQATTEQEEWPNGSPKQMSGDPMDIVGHKTLPDFSHAPLYRYEADAMTAQIAERQKRREELMPTEQSAIDMMFEAFDRLRQDFGWREAIYCPKDGSSFEVLEAGSTGIFPCHYEGEWPTGSWCIEQDGGSPSRPVLFRLHPADEAKRQEKMRNAMRRFGDRSEGAPSKDSA